MSTDLGLGLSLVDNPVAAGGGETEQAEEELVVLPPQLQRIGALGETQYAACDFGWTFADDACFKVFGDGILGQPLGWADAEEACLKMGSQTHLTSVTSEEQHSSWCSTSVAEPGWWLQHMDWAQWQHSRLPRRSVFCVERRRASRIRSLGIRPSRRKRRRR